MFAPLNRIGKRWAPFVLESLNPALMLLMFILVFVPIAGLLRLYARDARGPLAAPIAEAYAVERDPGLINPF